MPAIRDDGLRTIRDVEEAEAWFNKLPVFRGNAHGLSGYYDSRNLDAPRCIGEGTRKKPHMTLRPLNDGSWACCLYKTDVVVYHPDGSIKIDISYNTTSTTTFACALLPATIRAQSTKSIVWANTGDDEGYWWGSNKNTKGYSADRTITLKRDENKLWYCEDARPFAWWTVNYNVARDVLRKYPVGKFAKWIKTYAAFKDWRLPTSYRSPWRRKEHFKWDNDHIELLANQRNWSDIGDILGSWYEYRRLDHGSLSTELQRFRELIYSQNGVYETIDIPFVTSEAQFDYVRKMEAIVHR